MRFAVFVVPGDRARYENGKKPNPEKHEKMWKFNESLANADVLVSMEGFHPTSKGARIGRTSRDIVVAEGPFSESEEVIGGIWIWNVGSKKEAIEWAKKFPLEIGDSLEIRQIYDA